MLVGGEVLIRHDPRQLPTAEWATSNAIVQSAAGNQTQKQVPLLAGTYFIAFRDQSGVRSLAPVAIPAVLPTPQPRLLVKTWAEENETPQFNGADTNLGYDAGYDALFLDPSVSLVGEYTYEDALDLGQVYDINVRRRLVSGAVTFGTLFDSVAGLFDDQPGDFDGADLDQANAVTYVRVTNDNPASSPVWGDWNEYANAIVRGRGIQLKVEGSTRTAQVGLVISELGATAELQQRTATASLSDSSTYTVTYAAAFYAIPDVTISPSNMATGDFFTLTAVTRTGFTVAFKNSASAAVTRSFAYTAVGYGRQI